MRILSAGFMYPPHDLGGGYELTWRSVVEGLRRRGHDVRVLACDWRRPDATSERDEELDVHRDLSNYWRDHEFPRLGPRARLRIERANKTALEKHLDEHMPAVVNLWPGGGFSLSLIELVKRRGIPMVGVLGDDWLSWGARADGWSRLFASRRRLGSLAESATGIPTAADPFAGVTWVFNSRAMRERHDELADAVVANPGVDTDLFEPARPSEWRWRLLCLGRLDPRKGVHIAIEALSHLPAEATLSVVGGGDPAYARELRDLVAKLGLGERVAFSTTPRSLVPEAYASTDAVLFPVQWDEPWGLVPLEAMAVGRPVVATGTGGSSEYLRNGENCLLYSPRDSAQALAEAVHGLADNGELRERLCVGGFETAARFTDEIYVDSVANVIEKAGG